MQQGLKGSIAGVVAAATLLAGGILTVPHAMALEADGQYYSSKQPYVAPSEATTASYSQAPEGYETVYTESMARHGSRGLSSYKYDALLMKMAEAAEADNGFKSDAIKSEFMKNLKAITAANVEKATVCSPVRVLTNIRALAHVPTSATRRCSTTQPRTVARLPISPLAKPALLNQARILLAVSTRPRTINWRTAL